MFLSNIDPYSLGITCLIDPTGYFLADERAATTQEVAPEAIIDDLHDPAPKYFDLPDNHRISDNFTYFELIRSDTATAHKLDNRVPADEPDILERAGFLARTILEPTRDRWGGFRPNSWFRGQPLEYRLTASHGSGFITFVRNNYRPGAGEPTVAQIDAHVKANTYETLRANNSDVLGSTVYALWLTYYSRKQHPKGEAADLRINSTGRTPVLRDWYLNELKPNFDQLILEFHKPETPMSGWTHISIIDEARQEGRKNRRMSFEIK